MPTTPCLRITTADAPLLHRYSLKAHRSDRHRLAGGELFIARLYLTHPDGGSLPRQGLCVAVIP
ncbi:hypothetical protein Q1J55_05760 [Pseudomonas syringae]|uniref:hypothetical protein n=1 Tax=Pseudomonas syringae TaxID=317 RepID=UPI0034D3D412